MWRIRESGDPVDLVIIVPERDRRKEIGQALLELADHPSQVQWVSWPQGGFQVSRELYQQFAGQEESPVVQGEAEKATDSHFPVAKRRGRPRKNPVPDTDNAQKEE
jgi:hypothetical protein